MAIMFGDGSVDEFDKSSSAVIKKTLRNDQISDGKYEMGGKEMPLPTEGISYYKADGTVGTSASFDFVTFDIKAEGAVIEVSANSFPGTYYVTGDKLRNCLPAA